MLRPGWLALILLGLLLVVPSVGAQEVATSVTVTIAPPDGPIVPLVAPREMDVRIEMPCAGPGAAPAGGEAHVWVVEAPSWLSVHLEPLTYALDSASCANGRITNTVIMAVRADADAPAHTPTTVRVGAAREGGATNVTGTGAVELQADYFAILNVGLEEAIKVGKPGERVVFPIHLGNYGNGPTRVTFELKDVTEGFAAEVPAPYVLGSRLQDPNAANATVDIIVTASQSFGYNNEVGVVNLRLLAEDASGRGTHNDESIVSLLVTSKGLNASPTPWFATVLGMVVAALAVRRAHG